MHWVKYLLEDGKSHAMAMKNPENHPHMRKFKLSREFLRNCIFMYKEKECHSLVKFLLEIVCWAEACICLYPNGVLKCMILKQAQS